MRRSSRLFTPKSPKGDFKWLRDRQFSEFCSKFKVYVTSNVVRSLR